MVKKKYTAPDADAYLFEANDILTISDQPNTAQDGDGKENLLTDGDDEDLLGN